MDYIPEPTVRPFPDFNAVEDATLLRKAMKGFGTDEQAIIDILCNRSNSQRQQIKDAFTREYGRDIIADLKSELGGKFEDVIIGLMDNPVEYMCNQLHKAMKGLGTDEETIVEIICSRNNREIKEIVDNYERLYNRPLAEHLCSETESSFRRLLTLLVTVIFLTNFVDSGAIKNVYLCGFQGVREEFNIDPDKAREDAQSLFDAGEGQWGTNEEIFNKVFSHSSYGQLRLIFQEYKSVSGGKCIEESLKSELSGELLDGLMAIVECVQDKVLFYANRLHKAMDGFGTNDTTLIRIIISRSEIDLANIKRAYEKIYNKTLISAVKQSETSGDYKKALLALIGDA
ncbi:annexin B10-like isoform X1 [Neocloeon triangulifer]|uniref:annexin B10-like isoform X1 n=1 Tax=Neocloeon triangulifer TaxID=2078957 RepID=UPI00286F5830|nr:annexin B10-like isoform X1 [Neocloeon triangulifer]XP_059470119.1 annexin B10-like isoform X1 [Neocloeon triangulifer]